MASRSSFKTIDGRIVTLRSLHELARSSLASVLIVAGALVPFCEVAARQAAIMAPDMQSGEVGQGWLMTSATRCLLVAPRHVLLDEGGSVFLAEGSRESFGAARFSADLGDDLAAADAVNRPTAECGQPAGSLSRSLGPVLKGSALGALRYVNGDGSVGRIPVSVIDDDGEMLVRIAAVDPKMPLRKGHSGSLLFLADVPAAMLLSVSARSGVGTALRSDVLLRKIDAHVRVASAPSVADRADRDAPSGAGEWRVVSWRHAATEPVIDAARLTDGDPSTGWKARLDESVAIELHRSVGFGDLSSLQLSGQLIDALGTAPRMQLLVSSDSTRRRWRSVGTYSLSRSSPLVGVELDAIRASSIRIELHGDPLSGNRGSIDLREIEVVDRPASAR